ncbi:MAG: hypothetical protein KDB90_07435 [Planctomycetes bacterium]|nr:hypothetical protein [Planctomycetota bacterium]
MRQTEAADEAYVARRLRDWALSLNEASPALELATAAISTVAMMLGGLVAFAGLVYGASLWGGGEKLGGANEMVLATGAGLCGVCALLCSTSKARRRRNIWLSSCAGIGVVTLGAAFILHTYFVPEGPGWFGTYGKPNSLWRIAAISMAFSTLAAAIARLLHGRGVG